MKTKHRLVLKITAGVLIVLFVAAAFSVKVFAPLPTGQVLVTRISTGGLCAKDVCGSETKLYSSGRFGDKRLTTSQITILKRLIAETDVSKYTAKADPNCPSAYDGQDISYTFPTKTGSKLYTVCTLNIPDNDPLFQYLSTL